MNTVWVVGPCSMESRDLYLTTAATLAGVMQGREWYYKASFDKANRSEIAGYRGPGLDAALPVFEEMREKFPAIRLSTDIHESHQAAKIAPFVDCIQIPAFLCRQTDLIIEAARHSRVVNIKKGQWISPRNILRAAEKARRTNPSVEIWLTERGTQFGYDRLLVDFSEVGLFQSNFDRVVFDCTHATQRIREDGRTTGDRELAERYLLSAPIFGYTGVFAEVHPDPNQALSDSDCQIDLARLPALLVQRDQIASVVAARVC